ncbi:MAG: hypothetical protein WCT39_02290 [Candidatus Margulisiibacteriota bacterium]
MERAARQYADTHYSLSPPISSPTKIKKTRRKAQKQEKDKKKATKPAKRAGKKFKAHHPKKKRLHAVNSSTRKSARKSLTSRPKVVSSQPVSRSGLPVQVVDGVTYHPWVRMGAAPVKWNGKLGKRLEQSDKHQLKLVGASEAEIREIDTVLLPEFYATPGFVKGRFEMGYLEKGMLVEVTSRTGGKITSDLKYVAWEDSQPTVVFITSSGRRFHFPQCSNWTREIAGPKPRPPVISKQPGKPEAIPVPTWRPETPKCNVFSPNVEAHGNAGMIFDGYGGKLFYYGVDAEVYLFEHGNENFTMSEGVRGAFSGWTGRTGGEFAGDISGQIRNVGPIVRLRTGDIDFKLNPHIGDRTDEFSSEDKFGKKYKSSQKTDLIGGMASADITFGSDKPIKRLIVWIDGNADMGHSKSSSYDGSPLTRKQDPAANRSQIAGGAYVYLHQNRHFDAGINAFGEHNFGDSGTTLGAGPFIEGFNSNRFLEQVVKLRFVPRKTFGSDWKPNNIMTYDLGGEIDLGRLFKNIFAHRYTAKAPLPRPAGAVKASKSGGLGLDALTDQVTNPRR